MQTHTPPDKHLLADACTVIIPTLAVTERSESLRRAIESLRTEKNPPAIIVIVNGARFDPRVVCELSSLAYVKLLQIPNPSLPAALLEGRRLVSTPFFSFLDDDDEYLPGAISTRLQILDSFPEADFVVSNGLRNSHGVDKLALTFDQHTFTDPLGALFSSNWLASCGGLFRTSSVSTDLFENIPSYLEWTWLAFHLISTNKKVAFLDEPTFRIHETPDSVRALPGRELLGETCRRLGTAVSVADKRPEGG